MGVNNNDLWAKKSSTEKILKAANVVLISIRLLINKKKYILRSNK